MKICRTKIILFVLLCIVGCTSENSTTDFDAAHLEAYPYDALYLSKQLPSSHSGINAREAALRAIHNAATTGKRSSGEWITQGPGNIGARINTIAVSPIDENIIFVGFSSGGVWRTLDGGVSWHHMTKDILYQAIGVIAFHPEDPNTVFVGTGDPNIGGYYFIGNGLYKSENLGESWEHLGLENTRIISSLAFHPQNPDIIFVGSMGPPYERGEDRGIYQTEDGGISWNKILHVDDQTGITKILIDPTDPNTMYAAAWTRIRNHKESLLNSDKAGVYKSIDAGKNWQKLAGGLPQHATSRVGIAMDPNDASILYAIVVNAGSQNPEGLYKTVDKGVNWESWDIVGTSVSSALGGFGWYFCEIGVDPVIPDKIYIQGVNLYSVRNADSLEIALAAPSWGTYSVHADKHDMVFAHNKVYLATDGGLYRSDYGETFEWEDIENIPTNQFYRVAYNPHRPDLYFGGTQDNGTTAGNAENINDWFRIFGGDGFQPAFYANDPNVWFAESQRGNIVYSDDAGGSFRGASSGIQGSRHWDMQYIISPHNDDVLYTATQQVYKGQGGLPPTWSPISDTLVDETIDAFIHQGTTIDQSRLDANFLAMGTSDGLVWVSTDEGSSWQRAGNGLPGKYVSSIKTSPNNAGTVVVTFSGYRDGDYDPNIFLSNDFGQSWQSIQGNLPQVAINDVWIYDYREEDNVLFVGTDGGVFYTENQGQTWELLGDNMPVVPVFDLEYHVEKNEIIAGTFGFSIMTFELDQIGIRPQVSSVAEQSKNEFQVVYRNGGLHITSQLSAPLTGYLRTLSGQLLQKKTIRESEYYWETGNLPMGIYVLSLGNKSARFLVIND